MPVRAVRMDWAKVAVAAPEACVDVNAICVLTSVDCVVAKDAIVAVRLIWVMARLACVESANDFVTLSWACVEKRDTRVELSELWVLTRANWVALSDDCVAESDARVSPMAEEKFNPVATNWLLSNVMELTSEDNCTAVAASTVATCVDAVRCVEVSVAATPVERDVVACAAVDDACARLEEIVDVVVVSEAMAVDRLTRAAVSPASVAEERERVALETDTIMAVESDRDVDATVATITLDSPDAVATRFDTMAVEKPWRFERPVEEDAASEDASEASVWAVATASVDVPAVSATRFCITTMLSATFAEDSTRIKVLSWAARVDCTAFAALMALLRAWSPIATESEVDTIADDSDARVESILAVVAIAEETNWAVP